MPIPPGFPAGMLSEPSAERIRQASPTALDATAIVERSTALLDEHRRQETGRISLYAGSNLLSPRVAAAHDAALGVRPALGWPGDKVQRGVEQIEELEVLSAAALARGFDAAYAEPRLLSATMANLAVYAAFTEPGDTVAVLSPTAGGHLSHWEAGTLGIRGLRELLLPYDAEALDVDIAEADRLLSQHRPRLLLVGGSVSLFPHDITALRSLADQHGIPLAVDVSHTAGLIVGGAFPNPLAEGAHLVTFSTYKTLAGPPGGAVVTNDPVIAHAIGTAVHPVLSSNYDSARLAPLAIAAAEAAEQEPAWAERTVTGARVLAGSLEAAGLQVIGAARGWTRSHQVVLRAPGGEGVAAMDRLAAQGILVGSCRLPGQRDDAAPEGIRIGTQEIVRLGADADRMREIAGLVHLALQGEEVTGRTAALRADLGPDLWGRMPATTI